MTAPSSSVRPRPSFSELGIHKLAFVLLILNALVFLFTLPFYGAYGLTIDWSTFLPSVAAIGFAVLGWTAHRLTPGRPSEWPVAETFVAFSLIAVLFSSVTPAQYLAVALNQPLVDPWLAKADALIGISVPAAVEWTRGFPTLVTILSISYYSLAAQFIAPLAVLGLYHRDRDRLWEYAFHFHVCLIVTLIGLMLFPAMCAFSYYGFESLIDQTRFISHFNALRAGTFHQLQLRELEGLITFPSFHVAGGLMVTWVFRGYRWMFPGLVVLNLLMIASTVLLGPHYAVDIIASLIVFAASVWLYNRWGRQLARLPGRPAMIADAAHAEPV